MPPKDKIIEELQSVSGKISEQVRTVAAGSLAFCLAFIVDAAARKGDALLQTRKVAGPIVFCLLAVAFDFGQYFAGYELNRRMLRKMEKLGQTELKYDIATRLYRSRFWCFNAKVICLGIGLVWLIVAVAINAANL